MATYTGAAAPKSRRGGGLARREAITFYLLISPWLLGLLLFVVGPMIASLAISFTRWDLLSPAKFIGLKNYEKMFTRDPLFWQSLKVTAIYTLVYVPVELVGGLVLALLMNQRLRGVGVFRTIYYLPSVLPGVAFVVLWMWMLHPDVGLVNTALSYVGIEGPRWLVDPRWALPALGFSANPRGPLSLSSGRDRPACNSAWRLIRSASFSARRCRRRCEYAARPGRRRGPPTA